MNSTSFPKGESTSRSHPCDQTGRDSDYSTALRALYSEKEAMRAAAFRASIEACDCEFRAAESRRSLLGDPSRDFQHALTAFANRFIISQTAFNARFKCRESARDTQLDGPRARHVRFARDQEGRESRFNRELSWYVTQIEALIIAEQDVAISLESRLRRLVDEMSKVILGIHKSHEEAMHLLFKRASRGWSSEKIYESHYFPPILIQVS